MLDDIVSDSGEGVLWSCASAPFSCSMFSASPCMPAPSALSNGGAGLPLMCNYCCASCLLLQTTASLFLLGQRLASLQLLVHPLVVCCLLWRRPAASGTGQHAASAMAETRCFKEPCVRMQLSTWSNWGAVRSSIPCSVDTPAAILQEDELALLLGSCVCNIHAVADEPQRPARHDWLLRRPHLRQQGLAHTTAVHPHQCR